MIERPQPVVARGVLRTQADGLLVGFFGVIDSSQALVSGSESHIRVVAGRLQSQRLLELIGGFLVFPRAIVDEPQAIVARRSRVSGFCRLVAGGAGLGDPLGVLGVFVLSPLRLSQAGVRQAVVGVLREGEPKNRNGAFDAFRFLEFFQITPAAQVVGVSVGCRRTLIGK
jgi:hypothetical protein